VSKRAKKYRCALVNQLVTFGKIEEQPRAFELKKNSTEPEEGYGSAKRLAF